MHAASKQFFTVVANRYEPRSVLELGSCDVNGAVRELFPTARTWVGVDIEDGSGVDVVANAADWRPEPAGEFDMVVSASTFEHTPEWPQIVETAAWHCKPGGHCAFSTVRSPFVKHNARGGDWDGIEFYEDVTEEDLITVCEKVGFRDVQSITSSGGDVCVIAERDFSITDDMTPLEIQYRQACTTPSDINKHLPTMVDLCKELGAEKVIELGTRDGVSTVAWLYGLKWTGGRCWSVDIDPLPDFKFHHWSPIQGNDMDPEVLKLLPDDADIVFIDTSHEYAHTLAELNVYYNKVRPGGRIVLHDTENKHPEGVHGVPYPVRRAVEEFTHEEGLQWLEMPGNWGLGIIEIPENGDRYYRLPGRSA